MNEKVQWWVSQSTTQFYSVYLPEVFHAFVSDTELLADCQVHCVHECVSMHVYGCMAKLTFVG